MWICARKPGPAPQESTLQLTKASLVAFLVSVAVLQRGESKSTLMSVGAGGCPQGPVHCRWLYKCLCIACGCQGSTSHACCRTARASLHLLKGSFRLRCDAGPFLGLWACMPFAIPFCVPCMSNHHLGTNTRNMNERCKLSQLNALFAEGKAVAKRMRPKLEPQIWKPGY